jgi:hypothetical protein
VTPELEALAREIPRMVHHDKLRDRFAGMAMVPITAAALQAGGKVDATMISDAAYEIADAMLKARG